MGSHTFYCGCGKVIHAEHGEEMVYEHESLSCCNCGGQRCMDCVCRVLHDYCEDSCPDCC